MLASDSIGINVIELVQSDGQRLQHGSFPITGAMEVTIALFLNVNRWGRQTLWRGLWKDLRWVIYNKSIDMRTTGGSRSGGGGGSRSDGRGSRFGSSLAAQAYGNHRLLVRLCVPALSAEVTARTSDEERNALAPGVILACLFACSKVRAFARRLLPVDLASARVTLGVEPDVLPSDL